MPRSAAPNDFQVPVEGIGTFTFGRRTPRDVFMIRGEYTRLTNGNVTDDGHLADMTALAFVSIQQLAVQMPDGFSLESIDPVMTDDWEPKLLRIFAALREKELSFRPELREAGQAAHARRHRPGHAALHVARAVPGLGQPGSPQRRLRARHHALRDDLRNHAIRW